VLLGIIHFIAPHSVYPRYISTDNDPFGAQIKKSLCFGGMIISLAQKHDCFSFVFLLMRIWFKSFTAAISQKHARTEFNEKAFHKVSALVDHSILLASSFLALLRF
jgi:hypothetical protein